MTVTKISELCVCNTKNCYKSRSLVNTVDSVVLQLIIHVIKF